MTAEETPQAQRLLKVRPFYFTSLFFVAFAALSIALIATRLFWPAGMWLPLIMNALLLGAAAADYVLAPSRALIDIERKIPHPIAAEKSNVVYLLTKNSTGSPISLRIFDDVPFRCDAPELPIHTRIPAGSEGRLQYKLTPRVRGVGLFGNIHFWYPGPLNLIRKRGECWAQSEVKLYPGLALIERQRLQLHRATTMSFVRPLVKRGEGSEFDSLRDYVIGDDPRLIHWSATARRGKPIVRVNRMEQSQNVFLVIDAGRMMTARVKGRTKFDYALNAALLLAYGALEAGDNVGIMTVGRDVGCFSAPEGGMRRFGRILDMVFAVEPKLEEPRYHAALPAMSLKLTRRALVVIFTDLIDERASTGLKRYLMGLVPRHLPLVAAIADTGVTAAAEHSPIAEEDLYRKAVAAEMLMRRERLLAGFTALGMHVVNATPDRLSAATFDRYLDIKTRKLL